MAFLDEAKALIESADLPVADKEELLDMAVLVDALEDIAEDSAESMECP